jgi:hypothetical protein
MGDARSTLGVMGPTRAPYGRLVSAVDYIAFEDDAGMSLKRVNRWVLQHHRTLEFVGVGMRICSFGGGELARPGLAILRDLGRHTLDAILLSWCSGVRRDAPYILLNVFWILVGVVEVRAPAA